jgi:hypothetical protein
MRTLLKIHIAMIAVSLLASGCQNPQPDPKPNEKETAIVDVIQEFKLQNVPDDWWFNRPERWIVRKDKLSGIGMISLIPLDIEQDETSAAEVVDCARYQQHMFRNFSLSLYVNCHSQPPRQQPILTIFFAEQEASGRYVLSLHATAGQSQMRLTAETAGSTTELAAQVCPPLHDGKWHQIDLLRNVDDGTIEVLLDRAEDPLISVQHKDLEWGHVGFCLYDSEVYVGPIRLKGEAR